MDNRRENSRVDVRLPFKESIEDTKSVAELSPGVSESLFFEFPSPPSYLHPDPLMADWINYFDAKINAIASVLMTAVRTEEALPTTNINISAGGISFDTDKKITQGEVMEMRIGFDSQRTHRFYGQVMWIRNIGENRYRVGANFLNMSNDFVDEINRFVFSRQREILSRKRYNLS